MGAGPEGSRHPAPLSAGARFTAGATLSAGAEVGEHMYMCLRGSYMDIRGIWLVLVDEGCIEMEGAGQAARREAAAVSTR